MWKTSTDACSLLGASDGWDGSTPYSSNLRRRSVHSGHESPLHNMMFMVSLPLSCAVFAKSRFSRMRTISTPGTSSCASGCSLIGSHTSAEPPLAAVPALIRPRIVILGRADRRTTSRSEMIIETTMPISRSQRMERQKVVAIRNISCVAWRLCVEDSQCVLGRG
jgi:hypothetical protein